MARYIGPKSRIARKFGEAIFGADKVLAKRNFPPGQHGNNRRRKTSEYGVMLAEKQRLSTLTVYLKSSSATFLRRPHLLQALLVRSFSRALSAVSTM